MVKRVGLVLLLAIQAVGGSAITLAHVRDKDVAPAAVEARHDASCAILHDELRCALCHYAGTRVAVHQIVLSTPSEITGRTFTPAEPLVVVATALPRSAPRAPPTSLS